MCKPSQLLLISLLYLLSCGLSYAGPWFTGPLLAPSGHIIPKGHTNFEFYTIDFLVNGVYNNDRQLTHTPLYQLLNYMPTLAHGLTDKIDVQYALPYQFNKFKGLKYDRIGDVWGLIGYQLIEQKDSQWTPDLRVTIQEVFPTGKYQYLNPRLLGTDSTGLGSYQTVVALNLQLLKELRDHYLRTRLILNHGYASSVRVNGFNAYGGSNKTHGRINSGETSSVDLAFEYSLTQNWAAVMEWYLTYSNGTQFNGILGTDRLGNPVSLGHGTVVQQGLAPAVEYNFSSNIGLISGVWFTVAGKNTSGFFNYVLALNIFW